MTSSIFGPAISEMRRGEWGTFGPMAFQAYLAANGLTANTAATISIDSLERLPPVLRDNQVMVFRLGSTEGDANTQFALIGTPGLLHDYFLIDDEICIERKESFLPDVSVRCLYPYYIFPRLTETSVVNLAFASGLIGYALGLERPYPVSAPATGHSTYSFDFRAHHDYPVLLRHHRGQVEVDAVFVGRRHGRDCIFILEAKVGSSTKTLAKHKLVYPVLALSGHIPGYFTIVPVYMRAHIHEKEIRYHVVECTFPDPRSGDAPAVTQLSPLRHSHLVVPLDKL